MKVKVSQSCLTLCNPIQLNIKNTTTEDTNEPNTEMGVSWRKTYRLWLGTWEHAQHHSFLHKHKANPARYHLTQVRMAISKHLQKYMSPALADRVFTSSTTWEALFQYKITMKVQEKVKKRRKKKVGCEEILLPYGHISNYNYKNCVDWYLIFARSRRGRKV